MYLKSFKLIADLYNKINSENTENITPFQEWLLDNFYIIEREYRVAKSAFRGIGKLNIRYKKGKPCVYMAAEEALAGFNFKAEKYSVLLYLREDGKSFQMTTDELYIFPVMLKAAIIDKIAEVCKDGTDKDGVMIGRLITSFRSINDINWSKEFTSLCITDKVLSEGKPEYNLLSDNSKSEYRRKISYISKKSSVSEEKIAEEVLKSTIRKKGRESSVGYYLLGEGYKNFAKKYINSVPIYGRSDLYTAIVLGLTAALFILLCAFGGCVNAAFMLIVPISEIAVETINYIYLKVYKPSSLPAFSLEDGIPPEGKSAVAYPVLISSKKSAADSCETLEVCYAANKDDNLNFVLLADLPESDCRQNRDDEEIIGAATEGITRLNEKYGSRFFLLIRERVYSKAQGKWMGFERKRGALLNFAEFLQGNGDFMIKIGEMNNLADTKYIITLDADSVLEKDGAKKLIGTMIHPLCKPVIDSKSKTVKEGYGIIKPKVGINAHSASVSLFSRIFAGPGGVDPYSYAETDLYMNVFGEAIFTGKGIIDVNALTSCTKKAIPSDTVLSHDLLEGAYLRCGICSETEIFDSFPQDYGSYIKRQHRWVRGDWQLIKWLFGHVENADGEKTSNPLSVLSRWKIFDNLRRSFVAPSIMFALVFGCLFAPECMEIILSVSLAAVFMPVVIYIFDKIISGNIHFAPEKRFSDSLYGIKAVFYKCIMEFIFLAQNASISFDAAARSVIRIFFTKKNTLQWITAADAERTKAKSILSYYSLMKMSMSYVLGALLLPLFFCPQYTGVGVILAIIWSTAPFVAYFISREDDEENAEIKKSDKEFLVDTAKRIWNFFADYTTQNDNFLPPDNIQLRPYKGAAHRTSPTNIGLYMLTVVGAKDLGFISIEEMEKRLSDTLETLEQLEKWRGHLLNWYNTQTLEPLYPRYVSTVDSGNFICYLIAVCAAVYEYAGERSEKLVMRIKKLISETKFNVLFDSDKGLFSVGFSVDENKLSNSYYDMLESEARQTVFLSVARGEIKTESWFRLSRSLVSNDGYFGLVSWTGTMFEYFMPLILMREYKNTLLYESSRFAIRSQKKFAAKRGMPWGVSESGFFGFDASMNYQYKAFGIPSLALKRGMIRESVAAPYATLLALMVDTDEALKNLKRLKKLGAVGEYGFYEALDYTAGRVGNEKYAIVKSYMAHHQGMGFASVVNVLCHNIMQKRFEKFPEVKACLSLLSERVPDGVLKSKPQNEKYRRNKKAVHKNEPCVRNFSGGKNPLHMHALSNGTYSLLIDERGSGISSFEGITFERKRPYPDEKSGNRIFIKKEDGEILDAYGDKCVFSSHMAEYYTENSDFTSNLKICVIADESAELRRLTLMNCSSEDETYEITSYRNISVSSFADEIAHPAFSGFFTKTYFENGCLFAERKKRGKNEKAFTCFANVFAEGGEKCNFQYDTDRAAFLGRGINEEHQLKKNMSRILSESFGNILDPCFAIRVKITVKSGESASLNFVSGICETFSDAKRAAEKLKVPQNIISVFDEAYKYEKLKPIKLSEGDEKLFLRLLPQIYYSVFKSRIIKENIRKNSLPINELWKLGISGDNPIITVLADKDVDVKILEQCGRAHDFWNYKGIKNDIVFLCNDKIGYETPALQNVRAAAGLKDTDKGNGLYILNSQALSAADKELIFAASSLICGKAGLEKCCIDDFDIAEKNIKIAERTDCIPDFNAEFFNGFGGFVKNGTEYAIINRGTPPPAPWVNVISNENFGTLLSDTGGGYTWYGNSREMRLTPWKNDAISDTVFEGIAVEENSEYWSPQQGVFEEEGVFTVRHGQGFTAYERYGNTDACVKNFVPREDSVKIVSVRLKNNEKIPKTLKAFYFLKPLLGVNIYESGGRLYAYTKQDMVFCKNSFAGNSIMFLGGEKSGIYFPLTNSVTDKACAECMYLFSEAEVSLKSGEEKEIVFILGAGENENECISLFGKYSKNTDNIWEDTQKFRKEFNSITVQSGNRQFDIMVGGWLLYQVTSCRLFGRTGFYQSGGAFGFRDQLQDTLSLLYSKPDICRKQILRCAAHQFSEGDVLHWWHEGEKEKGVRTTFSDDRLWLPYVTAEYVKITGDKSVLYEKVPFIKGPSVTIEEPEKYFEITERTEGETLYEHCIKAIEISLKFGIHGLPLMGGGDWNDGMNKIGEEGKGESVFVAWFLIETLLNFSPICKELGDDEKAASFLETAEKIKVSANENAWDGEWFRRAYYDNGTPVGSADEECCKIDSVSQSWAVISGGTDSKRAKKAFESTFKILASDSLGIIKLLTPPFTGEGKNPGYIASYPEGIRENGGQYTHAAVWLAIAAAILGEDDAAWTLCEMLNPINHSSSKILCGVYKVEPYVMAADIYSVSPYEGRGGWTWYTGAAAWMYKLCVEFILGFKKEGDYVWFEPHLPSHISSFTLSYRYGNALYKFHVSKGEETSGKIKLSDDGCEHETVYVYKAN